MYKPERLAAFCDGVIAIAITLLVLGIQVPSTSKVPEQQLGAYLLSAIHPLIGFVTSFILVGTYWLAHYVIFHHVKRVDRIFIALNGLFLLLISFVPFPTGVQAAYRGDHYAFLFYAATQFACSMTLLVIWDYATDHRRLINDRLPDDSIRMIRRRIRLPLMVCIVAIAVSFLNLIAGRLTFLLIPIFYFIRPGMDGIWGPEDPTSQGNTT
jgi:uncharacterized membrane protein